MAAFFNSAKYPNSPWGASPRGVADALSAFMYGYAAWANEGVCFTNNGAPNTKQGGFAPEHDLIQAALAAFTSANGAGTMLVYPSGAISGL